MGSEQVYNQLEKEILLGILKPRERLLEVELCRKLGISRPLLREVFRRLEGVGLVAFHPNRGVVVREFSQEEIENVYSVRIVLERMAAPLIIQKLTSETLQQLMEINQDFEKASCNGDIAEMIPSNVSFHRGIWRITGNPFLSWLLDVAQLDTAPVRHIAWLDKERIQRSVMEHRKILSALAEMDCVKYEEAVEKHIDGAIADCRRILSVQSNRQSGSGEVSAISGERMVRLTRRRARKR
jgi:DNA-binding GntR family transcriptional regulator